VIFPALQRSFFVEPKLQAKRQSCLIWLLFLATQAQAQP
jgi:hypothetical protein